VGDLKSGVEDLKSEVGERRSRGIPPNLTPVFFTPERFIRSFTKTLCIVTIEIDARSSAVNGERNPQSNVTAKLQINKQTIINNTNTNINTTAANHNNKHH